MMLRFKIELSLLLSAILLYIVSALCYSYELQSTGGVEPVSNPYRIYAFPLIALASVLLAVAAILYSKRK